MHKKFLCYVPLALYLAVIKDVIGIVVFKVKSIKFIMIVTQFMRFVCTRRNEF